MENELLKYIETLEITQSYLKYIETLEITQCLIIKNLKTIQKYLKNL